MTFEQAIEILEDADPERADAAERATIKARGPLTRDTTSEQWDRYWIEVAERYLGVKS